MKRTAIKSNVKNETLLKQIDRVCSLSGDELEKLLICAEPLNLSRGEHLLKEGQICNYLYFVETGSLRTSFHGGGKEVNVGFTLEGQFISNIKSLKSQQPSRYKISTNERTLAFRFGKDKLIKLYNQSTALETFFRRIMVSMLIESDERFELMKLPTPAERYGYMLKNSPELIRRVSVTQLASYLGVARETLSRIRSKRA